MPLALNPKYRSAPPDAAAVNGGHSARRYARSRIVQPPMMLSSPLGHSLQDSGAERPSSARRRRQGTQLADHQEGVVGMVYERQFWKSTGVSSERCPALVGGRRDVGASNSRSHVLRAAPSRIATLPAPCQRSGPIR